MDTVPRVYRRARDDTAQAFVGTRKRIVNVRPAHVIIHEDRVEKEAHQASGREHYNVILYMYTYIRIGGILEDYINIYIYI